MSDALKLADTFDARCWGSGTVEAAAAELRRLHAENTALREATQDFLNVWDEWNGEAIGLLHVANSMKRLREVLETK